MRSLSKKIFFRASWQNTVWSFRDKQATQGT